MVNKHQRERKGEIDMATVGGLTTSTSTSIRGYGGLASGLDRDTLIEGMTSGTTSKITQQQKKQQQLEWKQAAIQSITSKLLDFSNKYTSWSSSTNLFSSMLWGRNKITTTGTNSKFVSVSGSGASAEGVTIMGVKQLAQKAKWSTETGVSNQTLSTTKNVDITETYDIPQLPGKELEFKLGNGADAKTYTLTLKESEKLDDGTVETYDYSTPDKAMEAINKQLGRVEVTGPGGTSKKLSDFVSIGKNTDGKFELTGKPGGNNFELTGGSALQYLGFGKDFTHNFSNGTDTDTVTATDKAEDNLIDHVSFARLMDGKKLTFSYNGKTAEISMLSREKIEELTKDMKKDDPESVKATTQKVFDELQKSIQGQLDDAFGKGRVKVNDVNVGLDANNKITGANLSFKTVKPDGTDDKTSTLKIVSGNADVKYVLGVQDGMSNRVNMSDKLKDKLTFSQTETTEDAEGNSISRKYTTLTINDAVIKVYEDDTMGSLMERINNTKEARVKISYQEAADKFTFTSTEEGASGTVKLRGPAKTLFGLEGNEYVNESGQDAIVAVKYAGSDEAVELTRGSNSFTVDGLTINVKGKFGYDENGALIEDDPDTVVEIDAQVDSDSIVDAVKSMIEEYNSIIELVNKEVKTKPDRDYEPLTSEQKKELSEDEIEAWEKKAKEGLLYADSDIRSLTSDLRFIIDGGIAQELAEMGISTSSSYSDNGKINFDESKFRAALSSNPERVQELFAESSVKNTNGNGYSKGIGANLKSVLDKYVNTTGAMTSKGILIRKAGHESSPMSVTENTMYSQLKDIKERIASLQERLETERDRYIKQFTSLETLISQMNNQSSWLSQFGG
jgi:flagellar hook-associated protein 2